MKRRFTVAIGLLLAGLTGNALAASIPGVNFHVVTHYRVPRTVVHANLEAQATGISSAAIAAQVNATMAWAATKLHTVPGIHWHSTGYQTYRTGPKGKDWTVRETIKVRGKPSVLLPLLGTLQSRLHLVGLSYAPAAKVQKQAMQQAVLRGLHRYRKLATQDCKALGFSQAHSGRLFIDTPTTVLPHPLIMMAARAVPGPVVGHGGEDVGRVVVGGNAYCEQ